ncbi:MAG: branched-chain amino acid ABC transporter permease [Actinobacteria bacterium]|nr:MAG: branched-chain amino acid ABC transporter permease [Actinomycetota bacterium]
MADELTPQVPPDQPRIGVDEWVASVEGKRERYRGPVGWLRRGWDTAPAGARLLAFVIPAAIFPLVTTEGNLFRYGLITLLYALLGLGLNVTVGFAGLLDLGYIAFFGFGAYTYGYVASVHTGHHWPAVPAILLAIAVAALIGFIVGFPSRRLVGDYLAIVTLFFGQAFVVFVNNGDRINFWPFNRTDLTGGANGLDNIDPLKLFGWTVNTTKEYYWFTLGAFLLVIILLYLVSESRTGRAWKALREDPLAAEVMSMPVNRLKLMAFVFGAAIAGFAGAIYGSVQTGAFPGDFDVGLLITIYAIVILGGAGSLAGVIVGALVVNGVPELLRDPNQAEWVFYTALVLLVLTKVRPWQKLVTVVGGTLALGFALVAIADAWFPRWTAGEPNTGKLAHWVSHWMLLPSHATQIANWAYALTIALILVLTLLRGWWRTIVMIPTIYVGAFAWENLLVEQTVGATRFLLLGALLVVLMNARPQGLFGTARVEIV